MRRLGGGVAEGFGADQIILFGSYAYGEPNQHSDVDLLVVMPARDEISQAGKVDGSINVKGEFSGTFYNSKGATLGTFSGSINDGKATVAHQDSTGDSSVSTGVLCLD